MDQALYTRHFCGPLARHGEGPDSSKCLIELSSLSGPSAAHDLVLLNVSKLHVDRRQEPHFD